MLSIVFPVPSPITSVMLPEAELSAARLDGELFALDESWVCADEPDSPDLRARALTLLLPRSAATARLVMIGLTAAWLHGATDVAPFRHEVCSRSDERASIRLPLRFRLRELCLTDSEECWISGLRVTTPARTAFDLGRRQHQDDQHISALRALVLGHRISPADAADPESANPLPGARMALQRIAAVTTEQPLFQPPIQPPLTR